MNIQVIRIQTLQRINVPTYIIQSKEPLLKVKAGARK